MQFFPLVAHKLGTWYWDVGSFYGVGGVEQRDNTTLVGCADQNVV